MRIIYNTLLLLLITSLSIAQNKKILRDADVIIRNVTVLDMVDSMPKPNQIVCINDGTISYIGADETKVKLKTSAKIIEAKGKYLMPGMAEMHAHMPAKGEVKNYFTMNLLAGVTMIRSMRGKEEHLAYRNIKDYAVPHLYLGAPVIRRDLNITPQVADSIINAVKTKGYDFIKILSIKDSTSFDNITLAAKKAGVEVGGHAPKEVSLEHLLNSGYHSISHLGGYAADFSKNGDKHCMNMLELTKKNNVYQDMTLDWYQVMYHAIPTEELKKRAGMQLVPQEQIAEWDENIAAKKAKLGDSMLNVYKKRIAGLTGFKTQMIKYMADMGVGLLVGSEGGGQYMVAGYNMLQEMREIKKAGLSNYYVLKCATVNAAKYMNQDDKWGVLKAGFEANMILLPENPLDKLEAIAKVEAVVLDNNVHTQQELKQQLN